jgi:hypothetical protein
MSTARPNAIAIALQRPLLRRALVVAVVAVHVLFVIAPLDVLFPVVAHDLGQRLLHGEIPYRDFALEYPPLAAPMFLLPGLAPAGIAKSVLALQALALEALVVQLVMRPRGADVLWRWAFASVLIFPFLSGGFDALPMATLAVSTMLLAEGRAAGWWVAAVGAAAKVSPGTVWAWARRPLVSGVLALAVTAAVLFGPLTLAKDADDAWLGFSAHRGVQVESTAGVTTWLAKKATGDEPTFVYNQFKSWQVDGGEGAAKLWLGLAAVGFVVLVVRCGREGPDDPWLAALAAACLLLVGLKVFSPQFVAWATPLAVVLGGRWWRLWAGVLLATVAAYFVGGHGAGFFLLAALRDALVVVTAVLALREVRPARPATPAASTGGRPAGPPR